MLQTLQSQKSDVRARAMRPKHCRAPDIALLKIGKSSIFSSESANSASSEVCSSQTIHFWYRFVGWVKSVTRTTTAPPDKHLSSRRWMSKFCFLNNLYKNSFLFFGQATTRTKALSSPRHYCAKKGTNCIFSSAPSEHYSEHCFKMNLMLVPQDHLRKK